MQDNRNERKPMLLTIKADHKVVLIKIPRAATDGDPTAMLEAASKWWVVGAPRRDGGSRSPDYALAVIGGRVRAAYRIDGWNQAPAGRRWGFTGTLDAEMTDLYQGTDITGYFPRGAANPLRYVNCDLAAAAPPSAEPELALVRHDDLADIAHRLDAEPLTHLMFGNRELCHSNLLAWFFRAMPERADGVFGSLTNEAATGHIREVRREKKNLDLWFRWPDRNPLVIENKVFSLPDEAQLERYTVLAHANAEQPTLRLLSLADPGWLDDTKVLGGTEWRWLSYRELAARIRSALDDAAPSYETETMRRYAGLVEVLSDLVDATAVGDHDETVSLPVDMRAALGDRLATTLEKLRARSIAGLVSRQLHEAGVEHTLVGSDVSNTQSVITWLAPIDRGHRGLQAGWQLQGGQLRLALVMPHLKGTTKASRQARYEFALSNEDLFGFGPVDGLLGTTEVDVRPRRTPARLHGFLRYDPDFVYRYTLTPDITVAQLVAAALVIAKRRTDVSARPVGEAE